MSRQLTVDLGFNFDTQPFGPPLGKDPAQTYYPLQIGINDSSDNPVWSYALRGGDRVRFKVTDITHSASADPVRVSNTNTGAPPSRVVEGVFVAFVNPDTIGSGNQTWPFTSQPSGVYQPTVTETANEPGLRFDSSTYLEWQKDDSYSAVYCQLNPGWSVNRWHCKIDSQSEYLVLVDTPCFVKCSVLVRVTDAGATKDFILDPEWYVGPHGG